MLSPTTVLVSIASLLALSSVVHAGGEIKDDLKEKMDLWNLFSRCYGEENLVQWTVRSHKAFQTCYGQEAAAPAAAIVAATADVVPNARLMAEPAFGRLRREVEAVVNGLLQPTAEQEAAFDAEGQKLAAIMATKIGNLTCVLKTLDMMDADGNVKLEHFTVTKWNKIGQSGPAKDPAFVQKMKDGYADCHAIAAAWPEASLAKGNTIAQQWGRQMGFFKCAKKMEMKNCYAAQVKTYLETLYGPIDVAKYPEVKGDAYEAAMWAHYVREEVQSDEEKAVHSFLLRGKPC
jgi:hypothetical protein